MNRILVTGGAGFIGSNLCAELVKQPDNYVIALDNLFTGRKENIQQLIGLPNFDFVEWDVQKQFDTPVDQIYNAACPASPRSYQAAPSDTTKTCVLGMLNMLELAKRYNARVMQFSTSEVYGDPNEHPQRESYWGNVNPIGIRSCYDEGKRCAESLCFDYVREFNTKVKVIRIFNTYGPNMDPKDGRVISNFIVEALKGEPLTVYGDGSQTRSFCYVKDLIRGIILMMNDTEDDFHGPVNLGNPGEYTMLELAQIVLKKIKTNSKIVHMPLPCDDPTQRKPNINYAIEKLHWNPEISLDEGLDHTIAYYRERIV